MSDSKKEEDSTAPEVVEETPKTEVVEEAPVVAEAEAEEAKEEKAPETVPAAREEAEKEAEEEEVEVVEEKVYTIPIGKLGYATDRGHRAPKAIRDVRNYVSRHMRAEEVSISNEINETLWARGINKPPRKVVVRAVKDKEGKVVVYPAKT